MSARGIDPDAVFYTADKCPPPSPEALAQFTVVLRPILRRIALKRAMEKAAAEAAAAESADAA